MKSDNRFNLYRNSGKPVDDNLFDCVAIATWISLRTTCPLRLSAFTDDRNILLTIASRSANGPLSPAGTGSSPPKSSAASPT